MISRLPLVAVLLLISCAGQIPPGGGPVDSVPPTVEATTPDSNAINVRTSVLEFSFSEYVDRRSFEESFFISPYLGKPEFDWSGTTVRVAFPDSLKAHTTYVATVGTDVKDIHAGNRMDRSFTLAFSTGDSLDRGMMVGRVYDAKPEGILMFAYRLAGIERDTLNPSHTKPDYITQTGKNGFFELAHLTPGPYRVVGVRDQYHDLLYDREVDEYGVTWGDIMVDGTPIEYDYRLTREDTTRPFLTKGEMVSRTFIQLRFSEPMDTLSFDRSVVAIVDTATRTAVPVKLFTLSHSSPTVAGLVLTTGADSGQSYTITVGNAYDRAGNLIDPAHASVTVEGSSVPDTVAPHVNVRGVRDSTRGYPLREPFIVDFSEPVTIRSPGNFLSLRTADSAAVPLQFTWIDRTAIAYAPATGLKSAEWYQLTLQMGDVKDLSGNGYGDTTRTLHVQMEDLRQTGTVEGDVIDRRRDTLRAPVFVTAHSLEQNGNTTIRLERPGHFEIAELREGRYTISAFIDADSSGDYSYGSIFPFRSAERFAVVGDTLKVRARWGLEGIVVDFR